MIAKVKPEIQRLRQLQRTLVIIQILAPLRLGLTATELARAVRDDLGVYGLRTIRRDLFALEPVGLIERHKVEVPGKNRMYSCARWRWVDQTVRGAILRHAAQSLYQGPEPIT